MYLSLSTQISMSILSSAETPQVVDESGGEPLRTLLMSAAQGGWMSLGIFLGWATGKSTRALVEGAPSFFGSGRRSDAMQHEEGRPEIECTGKGVGCGEVPREGRWGVEGDRNHLPAYVMPRVCRSRKQAVRERTAHPRPGRPNVCPTRGSRKRTPSPPPKCPRKRVFS